MSGNICSWHMSALQWGFRIEVLVRFRIQDRTRKHSGYALRTHEEDFVWHRERMGNKRNELRSRKPTEK